MKLQITSLFAAALMAGSVAAHSWLECVDSDVPNYAAAKADPNIDPYVWPAPLPCLFEVCYYAEYIPY